MSNHLLSSAIGLIALFFALSGGAFALTGVNTVDSGDVIDNTLRSADIRDDNIKSRDVKDGSLTGADVSDGSLTGADIDESTLGAVPNADALAGAPASSYLQRCQRGTVAAWAIINSGVPFGAAYGTTGVVDSYNCASGAVLVRKVSTREVVVCVPNNRPDVVFTSPMSAVEVSVSWSRVTDLGCPGGTATNVTFSGPGATGPTFSMQLLH